MFNIHIQNISLCPIIGVYEAERVSPQELFLDLVLRCTRHNLSDDIQTTVDYSVVVPSLVTHINTTRYRLIETLADDILNFCINYPNIEQVNLRLYKPSALLNGLVSISNSKTKCS